MTLNPFLNSDRQLRNGWWVLIFFLLLAAFLMPMIIIAQENNEAVSMGRQALIILLASLISQFLMRKPLADLIGTFSVRWLKELCVGGLIGSEMMLVPAFVLGIFGWVRWQWNPVTLPSLSSSLLLFAGVAAAEELLFRGFVFQRLISGLGQWPAQLITAAFFLLKTTVTAPAKQCPQCGGTDRKPAGILRKTHNPWVWHLAGGLFASLWGASREQQVRCAQCDTLYLTDTRGTRIAGVALWVFILLIVFGVIAEQFEGR